MYCRQCKYDLRGQTVPRCPECGQAYVPGDATTYFEVIPAKWMRATVWLKQIVRVLAVGFIVGAVLPGVPTTCGGISYSNVSAANLKHITTIWILESQRRTPTFFTTPLTLRDKLAPRLSARTQTKQVFEKSNLSFWIKSNLRRCSLALLLFGLCMAALAHGRIRRVAVAAAIFSLIVLLATYFAEPLAKWYYPGNYDYLQDFTFVDGWIWTNPTKKSNGIAAYETTPWWNGRRNVAFGDGHVSWVPEEEFQRMAMEQGIVWDE